MKNYLGLDQLRQVLISVLDKIKQMISQEVDYVEDQEVVDMLSDLGLDTTTELLPAVTNESYVGAAILSE